MSPDLPHEFSLRTIGRSQPGTIVVVKNLFEKLPVRRRAICVDQELIKLKELIRFLSIVHYTVNFNIYPLHKGKAILELPAQLTLLERLSFLHNLDLSKHFAVSVSIINSIFHLFLLFILFIHLM